MKDERGLYCITRAESGVPDLSHATIRIVLWPRKHGQILVPLSRDKGLPMPLLAKVSFALSGQGRNKLPTTGYASPASTRAAFRPRLHFMAPLGP